MSTANNVVNFPAYSERDLLDKQAIIDGLLSAAGSPERLTETVNTAVFVAIAHVLRGRSDYKLLDPGEKSSTGVVAEKELLESLKLPFNTNEKIVERDTVINSIPVDVKFTGRKNGWMIPKNIVGSWCLLIGYDAETNTVRYGLLKVIPDYLNKGLNRDKKTTINKAGRAAIHWITA